MLRTRESEKPRIEQEAGAALSAAFAESGAQGLVHLATVLADRTLPATLAYWREFALRYLCELRRTPPDVAVPQDLPPTDGWEEFMLQAPPGRGMEYLSRAILDALWEQLQQQVHALADAHRDGVRGWLEDSNPMLHQVGRVTFHLAENKRDDDRPFAFIATYSHGLSGSRDRLQHVPLSKALRQYAGERNRAALEKLLSPVQQAADKSEVLRELVDSRRLFQPLAWRPAQAYRFIQDIPVMEESGVVVRLPDWWKARRPPRPQVSVSVGNRNHGLGAEGMLDFSVEVTLDGGTLSEDELVELLESESGLVRLKGQWVEVDQEKLEQVLNHWMEVADHHFEQGISFLEGMRLLAGYGAAAAPEEEELTVQPEWPNTAPTAT